MGQGSKFITIIRPDFMAFCNDACRAAAFNHILFRIAGKCKDQPKAKIQSGEITWYAKTEQIREEMSRAWGVCKIRQEVNELFSIGIVGRSNNPNWGADRTKHFAFGSEQCKVFLDLCEQHSICVVHLGLSPEVTHLIYSSNANDRSIKCSCEIESNSTEQMIDSSDASMNSSNGVIDPSNANDEFIEAIPIDSPTIDDNKETDTRNVITDTAHADVSTSHKPLSENKAVEETKVPETESQVEVDTKPPVKETARKRNTGKSKISKKDEIKALLAAGEIPAPKKPDPATHPYNGELFMELGDFYRGSPLPVSNQPHSLYMQAVTAAASLVQRKARFEDVDKVFRYLLGLDEIKDLQWIEKGYNTDLWIVARHLTNKCLEYQRLEQSVLSGKPSPNQLPPTNGNTITHGQRPEDYSASAQARARREALEREWAEEDAAKASVKRGA